MEPTNKIETETTAIIQRVTNAVITTQEEYSAANHIFQSIRALKKTIKDDFKDSIADARALHKKLLEQQNGHLQPLEEAEGALKTKLKVYINEQERIRQEAERRAREETERLRKIEEDRILKEAQEAKENDVPDSHVDQILTQEVIPETPEVIVPEKPDYDARIFKKNWKFRIIDAGKIPAEFMKPDEVKIGQYIRAMKADAKISGVEIYEE